MRFNHCLFFILLIDLSCQEKERLQVQSFFHSDYRIEVPVKDDSVWHGEALYFDKVSHSLVKRINYRDGFKDGKAITYFRPGLVKDSFYYVGDKESGMYYTFNPNRTLSHALNYYHGLKIGPALKFENGRLISYNFFDLERQFNVFRCDYDSLGNIINFTDLDPHATLSELIVNQNKVVSIFSYLPRPPLTTTVIEFGIRNVEGKIENSKVLNNSNFYLDTILPYPKKGSNYFISFHMRDSAHYNKIFLTEFRF